MVPPARVRVVGRLEEAVFLEEVRQLGPQRQGEALHVGPLVADLLDAPPLAPQDVFRGAIVALLLQVLLKQLDRLLRDLGNLARKVLHQLGFVEGPVKALDVLETFVHGAEGKTPGGTCKGLDNLTRQVYPR